MENDYLRRFELSANRLTIILALLCAAMVSDRVLANNIYVNEMLQDLMALLDGVYRIHSGQLIHQDFSSALGLFAYALPAAFMSLGAGIVASVNYSEAAFTAVAFLIYLYIYRSRLNPMAGFFLGIWVPLALLARMNFGESFDLVTEAMQYNRRCDVFLLLLFLLFVPASQSNRRSLTIDGALYGAISSFLLYTKLTFGLVALGFMPIMLIRNRCNVVIIAVAMITFIVIVTLVERVYGIRFAWLADLRMSGASVERNQLSRVLHVVANNGLELFGFLFIPVMILLRLRRLTISIALSCVYIASTASLIVSYSAQFYALSLPIAFLFIALDALRPELAGAGATGEIRARYVLFSALASGLLLFESYPLVVNVAISTYRGMHGVPIDGTNEILVRIVTGGEDDKSNLVRVLPGSDLLNGMSKLDVFSVARANRPSSMWDSLSVEEYAAYLKTGISAAREGCENRARVSTIDVANPFPMLLGWPAGGGMIFFQMNYLVSQNAHLPSGVMFRDINCVMIPKLPAVMASRDTLLDIYGPFLSKSFERSYDSDTWTVLRRSAKLSNFTGP
jgi:hypothetical protein